MKAFADGDQLCITSDNFTNLQESPAVFLPLSGYLAKLIIEEGDNMDDHQKIRLLLDSLAEKRALQEVIRLDKEKARDNVITTEIRQALADIDDEFAGGESAAAISVTNLEDVIRATTLEIGDTVKGDTLYAVFSKPRITWNNPGLEGFAKAHPEMLALRKIGKPSVSIRPANKK